jgi:hypothetical protein
MSDQAMAVKSHHVPQRSAGTFGFLQNARKSKEYGGVVLAELVPLMELTYDLHVMSTYRVHPV